MDQLHRAIQLLFRNPVPSNPSIYLNLLQMCVESKAGKEGRLIHKYVFFNGFDLNLTVNNKMIIFYGKIGDMGSAHKVFDKMPERNIVSWTALLSGYSQNGLFKDAMMLFRNMHCSGVKGNQFTYGSVLRSCTKLMCIRSGKQVQGYLEKTRFIGNVFVQSALVDMYSKCGSIEDASYVFRTMSERDLVCWNTMIGGYTTQGCAKYAFQMFQLMLNEGITPDCFTFGSLLAGCTQGIYLLVVLQLHGHVIQHGFGSVQLLNRLLIDAYAKCGSTKCAYNVLVRLRVKDVMLYTSLINGYSREGNHMVALNLFIEAYQSGITLDDFLLCTVLSICANSSSLDFGREVHALDYKYVPMNDVAMGNVLIDMYAKCGELVEANRAFNQMSETNIISWSSLIDGYAKHGYGHKAITLLREMEKVGLKPNDVTFLSLLFACSHAGLVKEGWECFNIMIDKYNVYPSEKHWTCMVDMLARGGQLEEAYKLMQRMNFQPSASVLGVMVGSSSVYGDISSAELAAQKLSDLDAASCTTLAGVYAAAGSWDNSWNTHKFMEHRNMRKSPGHSLI